MFEKPFFSKLNMIADWIIRLVVLNLLMILFCIPIVTSFASISAGFSMLKKYLHNESPELFKGFWVSFKRNFLRKLGFTLLTLFIFLLGYLNTLYYRESISVSSPLFMSIGYYVSMSLIAIWFAVTIYYTLIVDMKEKTTFLKTIKFAFYLAGKYFITTFVLFFVTLLPVLLMFYPNGLTSMVFLLVGLTGPWSIIVLLTRKITHFAESVNL
ncbi:MAG: DUF624 domain-containing protein [Candidatus Izemoplasmatales bacterium]